MRPNQSRGVARNLLFTLALSSVSYFLISKSGRVGGGWGAYIGCLMWCPGMAALLSCKYLGRDLSTLGWKWGKTRYEIACYLIPLGYASAIYALVWLTGLGGFYNRQFYDSFSSDFRLGPMKPWANIPLYFVFTATITVVRDCATVLGEEIGWRDFSYRSLPNDTASLRLPSFPDSSGPCGTIRFFYWRMARVAARRLGTTCHCLRYCCRSLASYGPG
jgi:hypothetical protein